MDHDTYHREEARLQEVLTDAVSRGDYFLEIDTIKLIIKLRDEYYKED